MRCTCFNPYRVFSIVATLREWVEDEVLPRAFQSLSGFLYRCDHIGRHERAAGAYVSIPIGFSLSLRRREIRKTSGATQTFQSLSGFLYRCDICREPHRRHEHVSIPIGFSLSLRRPIPESAGDGPRKFQSLSGFLYRCDADLGNAVTAPARFQSLSGFLYRCDRVQPHHLDA